VRDIAVDARTLVAGSCEQLVNRWVPFKTENFFSNCDYELFKMKATNSIIIIIIIAGDIYGDTNAFVIYTGMNICRENLHGTQGPCYFTIKTFAFLYYT
jgi:hypothetical protein